MRSEGRVYPSAKFDQPCNVSIVFSMAAASIAFILMVLFTVNSLRWSVVTETYSGLLLDKIGNVSYILAVLPEHGQMPLRDYIGLNINSDSDSLFFTMECMLLCHRAGASSKVIRGYLPNVSSGLHTVFTTSVFSHRSLLVQVYLSEQGVKPAEWDVEIVTIRNTERFGEIVFRVRLVLTLVSLLLAATYAGVVRIAGSPLRIEHGFTFASIILCPFACFPLNAMHQRISSFVIEKFFGGLLTSVNMVALCVFVRKSDSEKVGPILPFAAFFVGAVIMCYLTDDTQILALMFDNSLVVWAFFLITSGCVALVCAAIVINSLVLHKCKARSARKPMFYGYLLSLLVAFFPVTIEGFMYAFSGYKTAAVEFFSQYLAQCLLSFLYVDMHWPVVNKETVMDDEFVLEKEDHDELELDKVPEMEMFIDT